MMTLDRLMASAKTRSFPDEASIDRWLDAQHIEDVTLRIAAKHSLHAQALATDQLRTDGLTTDRPESRYDPRTEPLAGPLATMFKKAGLAVSRSYSQSEVDDALKRSPLDITERLAVHHELATRQLVRR